MSNVADLSQAISSKSDSDRAALLAMGKQLDEAQDKFNAVASDPKSNPGQIEAAKLDFERMSERFKAKTAIMDVVNRLINDIIQRLGQIGR